MTLCRSSSGNWDTNYILQTPVLVSRSETRLCATQSPVVYGGGGGAFQESVDGDSLKKKFFSLLIVNFVKGIHLPINVCSLCLKVS